jgi:hypothetical protein
MTDFQPALLPDGDQLCRFDPGDDGLVEAGEILAQTGDGYLIQAMVRTAGGGLVLDVGHYLILPRRHIGFRSELPMNWTVTESFLLSSIPGFGPIERRWPAYFLYYIFGRQCGQTIFHLHGHVRVNQRPTGWEPVPSV